MDGYRPLLRGFFADNGGAFAALCQSLEMAVDRPQIARQAHRFQGAAHLLGLCRLAELGQQLAADPQGDLPAARAALQRAWQASQAACRRMGWLA